MTHPDLEGATDLATSLGFHAPAPASGAGSEPAESFEARQLTWKRRVKRRIRRMASPLLRRAAAGVSAEVRAVRYDSVRAELGRIRSLQREHAAAIERLAASERRQIELTINQELFKAELASVYALLDDLGSAIAPGAGLGGVAARLAELRSRLNLIDRRVRALPIPERDSDDLSTAEIAEPDLRVPTTFDYVGFEARFRGDSDEVLAIASDRYLERLAESGPVLDIGCGRGELLELLAARGVEATGVDLDAGMVADARTKGLDVHHANALDFLRARPPGHFGSIIAIHVVEHLQVDTLVEMIELAASRLKEGGLFIAETPNPESLIVYAHSFVLDPTHVRPLHPSLMVFLCERAGFRDVTLEMRSPATQLQLPLVAPGDAADPVTDALNEGFQRLNHVLFGPQEYAVVARR